jgi:hypothetical protein
MTEDIVEVKLAFCREIASLKARMWVVGARSVVRMLQFNGKQGGEVWLSAVFTQPVLPPQR